MLEAGFEKHDRIGIYSTNNTSWVLTQYACTLADLVLVTINPAYRVEDLKHALKLTNLNGIVVSNGEFPRRIITNVERLLHKGEGEDKVAIKSSEFPHLKKVFVVNCANTKEENFGFFNEHLRKSPSPKYLARVDEIV